MEIAREKQAECSLWLSLLVYILYYSILLLNLFEKSKLVELIGRA